MTRLKELHDREGQSPWLDDLKRDWIRDGRLAGWIERGVRGLTSNPTTFQKAIAAGDAYDEQFGDLVTGGTSVADAYWDLVVTDIEDALDALRPVHEASGGRDGYASLELAPSLALDTAGSTAAARDLHERIGRSNLFVKIPGTAEGLPAIQAMVAEGRNVNVTLLFSLERYAQVMETYLAGLEQWRDAGGDLSRVHGVASFFVSRVDSEVDARLEKLGTDEALALRGRAAVAQAKLAYRLFRQTFSGSRWEELAAAGANLQRPLWASTSTKNPDYPDTLYVDPLIAPDTVNTMPEATLEAFDDHGTVARTADQGLEEAQLVWARLAEVGVDLEDVGRVLEEEGVEKFTASFDDLMSALEEKANALRRSG